MAGLRSNTGWVMAARQTGQGVIAVPLPATAYKSPLVSGGLAPARTIAQLSETDSNRDQGISYVQSVSAGGAPEIYARDASLGLYLLGALGADAITGTTNFTHVLTPANVLPYLTMWRSVSDTLWESYLDCKISSLVIAATAGNPLTATATIVGRTPARLTTDPSGPPPTAPNIVLDSGYAYNYNDATVTLSGGATSLISSFSLTIDNSVTPQQTDDVGMLDVVEGQRKVTLTFDMIFSTLSEYNLFNYGGAAGTAVSSSIYTTSADFIFAHGVNNSIEFSLPSIAYDTFPVDVAAAGGPIVVSVTAVGQRGASPIVTATVKNQVATY